MIAYSLLLVGLILVAVFSMKIGYANGYNHGLEDGILEEGYRLKKKYGIAITPLEEDLTEYI